MLDIKFVRENLEYVIKRLETRNGDYSYLREIPQLDQRRRDLIKEGDELKNTRNTESKNIGIYKREGKNTDELVAKIAQIKTRIAEIDVELNQLDEKIKEIL